MYTVKHYGNEQTAKTASGAIRAAKQLVKTHGQGNKAPTIVVDTDAEADEMVKAMTVAREQYSVSIHGVPVI